IIMNRSGTITEPRSSAVPASHGVNHIMPHHVENAATTNQGLPVAPSMSDTLASAHVPVISMPVDRRVVFICAVAGAIAGVAGLTAQILMRLIWLITGISFHGVFSIKPQTPLENHLGLWVLIIPAIGGVIVGFIARYGSKAIRGHGIPEAMEQVLTNQ